MTFIGATGLVGFMNLMRGRKNPLMSRKMESLLRKALLEEGKMEYSLYEYELEEPIDYWYDGIKADRDDFVFVVTENSRACGGAEAMPAVLVEVGFVPGQEDAPKLSDPATRTLMAQAIVQGILDYLQLSDRL
jgi:hypothetical protein